MDSKLPNAEQMKMILLQTIRDYYHVCNHQKEKLAHYQNKASEIEACLTNTEEALFTIIYKIYECQFESAETNERLNGMSELVHVAIQGLMMESLEPLYKNEIIQGEIIVDDLMKDYMKHNKEPSNKSYTTSIHQTFMRYKNKTKGTKI